MSLFAIDAEDRANQLLQLTERLTDRLVHTADQILRHPGGTLPDKLNRNADLVGFYRLANNAKVTHGKLVAAPNISRSTFGSGSPTSPLPAAPARFATSTSMWIVVLVTP